MTPRERAQEIVDRYSDQIDVEFSPPPKGSSLAEREMTLKMYFRDAIEQLIEDKTELALHIDGLVRLAAAEVGRANEAEARLKP